MRGDYLKQLIIIMCRYPNFIIIGGIKCATTTLYEHIVNHSKCEKLDCRNFYFWTKKHPKSKFDRGFRWYTKQFESDKITGEACPELLYDEEALHIMSQKLPKGTKIIIVLRNPTRRVIAHYKHNIENKLEDLKLREAVRIEADRLNSGKPEHLINHGYIEFSKYYKYLINVYHYFDRKRILVINFDDLTNTPVREMKKVYKFLELKYEQIQRGLHVNKCKYNVHIQTSKKLELRMLDYFKKYNYRLEELGFLNNW